MRQTHPKELNPQYRRVERTGKTDNFVFIKNEGKKRLKRQKQKACDTEMNYLEGTWSEECEEINFHSKSIFTKFSKLSL